VAGADVDPADDRILVPGGLDPLSGVLLGISITAFCLIVAYRNNCPKGEVVPFGKAVRIAFDSIWGTPR
jgi:TRAP-type C4-dicarboxylate transport system permease large subunit